MSARHRVARILADPVEWNRNRLQVFLAVACVVGLAVLAGIVWSVNELLSAGSSGHHAGVTAKGSAVGGGAGFPPSIDDAQPGPLSTGSTGSIKIPQPSALGRAQVGTGFPESARGAMAQLIAIDKRAIESMSVVTAQHVIAAWAAPGGPSPESWSGVAAVQTLLGASGLPANGSTDLLFQLNPAMGLIQDTGTRTTVCVDFVLAATISGNQADRIAAADCQHMTWLESRWVIASGAEAVPSPSLWPGTQASYNAGYKWLEVLP